MIGSGGWDRDGLLNGSPVQTAQAKGLTEELLRIVKRAEGEGAHPEAIFAALQTVEVIARMNARIMPNGKRGA